jgi:hypothetical protein
MRRLLPTMFVVSIAIVVALSALLVPPSSTAGPVPAQTPTMASYLPVVLRPLPPTATPTPSATAEPPTATQSGPTATQTPTLPPPTYNNCQDDPNPSAAPNYPIRIIAIDKEGEIVRLRNESASPLRLSGWRMCSITGNQLHPIDDLGALAPGVIRSYTNGGGPIWNNSSRDDGALYDSEGRLVSYFFD